MSGLLNVEKVCISIGYLQETYNHLQRVGQQGLEGIVLWAGVREDGVFKVEATLIPEQTAVRTHKGLYYTVDGEALHRINVWLYEHKWTLVAQIHSHPGEAYHSEMDDEYPIISTMGGLSIVIPDFAFGPMEVSTWAVYRLLPQKGWVNLSSAQVNSLINILL